MRDYFFLNHPNSEKKVIMKIVLLVGNRPNHKALSVKLSEEFEISGIVIEDRKSPKKTIRDWINKINDGFTFYEIHRSWSSLMKHYNQKFKNWPIADNLIVEQINQTAVIEFIKNKKPDLILVSGTRILKKDLLAEIMPIAKIMNLHTGISPYIKGGPNCTNWCLADDLFHLIGNTVMWINEGIDSGNIIATERTRFNGGETLGEIHLKVMEHAHDLYIRAVQKMEEGYELNAVNQRSIAEGKLFLTKRWTKRKKKSLLRNIKNDRFSKVVHSPHYQNKVNDVNLIKL